LVLKVEIAGCHREVENERSKAKQIETDYAQLEQQLKINQFDVHHEWLGDIRRIARIPNSSPQFTYHYCQHDLSFKADDPLLFCQ